MTAPPDAFDLAITSGAVTALRRHAASIRRRAAAGVTIVDAPVMTIIKTSEAAHALRIARDVDRIADSLEGDAP